MSDNTNNTLPEHIRPGESFTIGSYTFEPDEIIKFATAWDPQDFHLDPVKAKNSLLGGLCASGWHTVSIWMKLQRKAIAARTKALIEKNEAVPEFGPSPGMKHLKWIKPVYAGDTITYTNTIHDVRPSKSRPGWFIMKSSVAAKNQNDDPVMSFESAVFLKLK